MSAVTDLLDQLVSGSKTVEQVADEFRTYAWPPGREPAADADEAFARDIEDPATPAEGSFFDVSSYFTQGKITDEQYDVLAQAATEGMTGAAPDGDGDEPGAGLPPAGGVDPADGADDGDGDETTLFGGQ